MNKQDLEDIACLALLLAGIAFCLKLLLEAITK